MDKRKNKNINLKPNTKKIKNKKIVETKSNNSNTNMKKNVRMNKYIKEIKKSSYKSVSMKLHGQLKKKDLTNSQKKEIKDDIEILKKWRKNNPNNSIKNNKLPNKKIHNTTLTNVNVNIKSTKKNNLFNSSIKEFKNNLNTDFLPSNDKKSNKIKQLTTKEILNLIKDE